MTAETADVLIVGGGIAGASLGAELAADGVAVVVLEGEDVAGYHSTGRSAAQFIDSYGPPTMRKFSRASRPFLDAPPEDFSESGFLGPRGILWIADAEHVDTAETLLAEESRFVTRSSVEHAVATVPILRPDGLAAVAAEPDARDIDVAGLHQAYLRKLRRHGGRLVTRARLDSAERTGGVWRVATAAGAFEAPVLVNAAGAWAGELARLAGVPEIALHPMRRSAAILPPPDGVAIDSWPLVADLGERFYFKPDAGRLFVSPAEEDPTEPGEAFVDDMALAEGLHRFEQAVTMPVTRVERSWAGLRTFANDRCTLVGFDSEADGFFWFAGQGGYGIQTAPAMAWTGAALAQGRDLPPAVTAEGLTPAEIDPRRPMPATLIGE